jgi:hypothetical protein
LSGIKSELGAKGFEVVESAINENPDVPGFVRTFKPNFPVGTSDNAQVHGFMQIPMFERSFVPFLVMIDREGMIRFQHTGSEAAYFDTDPVKQTANIRAEAEKLLAERPARPARRTAVKKTTK